MTHSGILVHWRETVRTMQAMLFFVVTTLCLSLADSVRIERFESRCPLGSFGNPAIGRCRVCTQPCPSPLVQITPCRHDADTVCGVPDADAHAHAVDVVIDGDKPRPIRPCSADSFYNRETGLCQECIRFCSPPLVMTQPCRRRADAVCSRPGPGAESRPLKKGEKSSSRRRKDNKHERRKRRKNRKRPKERPSHQTMSNTATLVQLCNENEEKFYDSARGRCRKCRSCDGAWVETSPCTSTSDRVCRPKHGPDSTKAPQTGGSGPELQSNELPKDGHVSPKLANRSRSNEYPDSRADPGSFTRPGETDDLQENSADDPGHVISESIHSNIVD